MKHQSFGSFDSKVYTSSNLRWKPNCHCGSLVALPRATRISNFGKQFWSCPYFKVRFLIIMTNFGITLFFGVLIYTRIYWSWVWLFYWFYEEVGYENYQFVMKQKCWLKKLTKEIYAAKIEVKNLRVTNEQQKADLLELQMQMKNIMNWKNFLKIMFFSCFHCISFKFTLILY